MSNATSLLQTVLVLF